MYNEQNANRYNRRPQSVTLLWTFSKRRLYISETDCSPSASGKWSPIYTARCDDYLSIQKIMVIFLLDNRYAFKTCTRNSVYDFLLYNRCNTLFAWTGRFVTIQYRVIRAVREKPSAKGSKFQGAPIWTNNFCSTHLNYHFKRYTKVIS